MVWINSLSVQAAIVIVRSSGRRAAPCGRKKDVRVAILWSCVRTRKAADVSVSVDASWTLAERLTRASHQSYMVGGAGAAPGACTWPPAVHAHTPGCAFTCRLSGRLPASRRMSACLPDVPRVSLRCVRSSGERSPHSPVLLFPPISSHFPPSVNRKTFPLVQTCPRFIIAHVSPFHSAVCWPDSKT